MSPISHKVKSQTTFDADVVKKPVTPTIKEAKPEVKSGFIMQDKTPSNWVIKPLGEGKIEAVNSKTGQKFEGSYKEFNTALRA